MTKSEFIQQACLGAFKQGFKDPWGEAQSFANAAPAGTFDQAQQGIRVASAAALPVTGPLPTTMPGYGKSKGEPIAGADRESLHYYIAGCRKTLSDPAKARWHDKERAMLAALEAELANPSAPKQDDGRRAPPMQTTDPLDGDGSDIAF